MITGKKDIDYKSEIAYPRRTVLDLALQHGCRLSLEDFLFQAAPMKPRYYSIASSNIKHPNEIRLVYRRIQVCLVDVRSPHASIGQNCFLNYNDPLSLKSM